MDINDRLMEFAILESELRVMESKVKEMKALKDEMLRNIFHDSGMDFFRVDVPEKEGMVYTVNLSETIKYDVLRAGEEYSGIRELAHERIDSEDVSQPMINAYIKSMTTVVKKGKSKEAVAKEVTEAEAWLKEFTDKVGYDIETKVVVREVAKPQE